MGSRVQEPENISRTKWTMFVIARFRMSRNWLFVLPALLLGSALNHNSGSAQAPCPIGGAAEIHYGPDEDLETIDVALLREATAQIDMAAYMLTDRSVVAALRQAARAGRPHLAGRQHGGKGRRLRRLGAARRPVQGLELRSSAPDGELMHLKGYCVDHRLLRTGSANFSRSGETRQDKDLVALRGAAVCTKFDAKFDRAWGTTHNSSAMLIGVPSSSPRC